MTLIKNERCAECGQPHPNLIRFEHGRPYCLGCLAEAIEKLGLAKKLDTCPVCGNG